MDVELLSSTRCYSPVSPHSLCACVLLLAPALPALTLHPYTLRASVTPRVDLQDPGTPTIPLARRTRCPGPGVIYVPRERSMYLTLLHLSRYAQWHALRDHLTIRLDTLGTSQQSPSRVISTVDPGSPLRGYSPHCTAVLCSCSSLVQGCRYYAVRSSVLLLL